MTIGKSQQHTILWADDDPDDMMIMREVLQGIDHDFKIIEVNDGQQALDYLVDAKAKSSLPCLVILDMNMPILSGRDALIAIKKNTDLQHLPIVVFTTSNSEIDKMFCKRYGVELVTKPANFTSFKEVVYKLFSFCGIDVNH